MNSIKTKFILGISIFVIFLFSITALLLITEKKRELTRDIYLKARSFSEFSTPKIIDLYNTLLKEQSFIIYNREIKEVFGKNEDINFIRIYSYSGEILYDSEAESERPYAGAKRLLKDPDLMARIKSSFPSYQLDSGRVVYLKKDTDGYLNLNENDKEVPEISDSELIVNIVNPVEGKYAVRFDITDENLLARIQGTTERILLLLVFGVLLGLGFGWYFAARITKPIQKLTEGAAILATGDFGARVKIETRDEVGVLAETFNKMAKDLQASTQARIYKERVAKELEMAAHIQRQILPTKVPSVEGLDIAASLIPAVEIGGDCYDFINVDDDTDLFYIADVTGHGVPAGIVVSIANAIIYSYSQLPSLKEILMNTNKVLRGKTASNMFMTALMVRYRKGVLDYVSAGHPEMLHYSAADKKVVAVKGGGIALGMVPDISNMVAETTVQWAPGDCLVMYSDGIPEANSPHNEQYGIQRLKRALSDHGELENAEAIKNAIIADIKQFMGNAAQLDDITIMVLRYTGGQTRGKTQK